MFDFISIQKCCYIEQFMLLLLLYYENIQQTNLPYQLDWKPLQHSSVAYIFFTNFYVILKQLTAMIQ